MAAPKQGKLYRAIKSGEYWTYESRFGDKEDDTSWCVIIGYDMGCLMLFLGKYIAPHDVEYRSDVYEFLSPVGVVCRTYFKDNDEFERWFEPAET